MVQLSYLYMTTGKIPYDNTYVKVDVVLSQTTNQRFRLENWTPFVLKKSCFHSSWTSVSLLNAPRSFFFFPESNHADLSVGAALRMLCKYHLLLKA